MVMVTTPYVPGYRVRQVLGPTWGTVVRSRGIGYQVAAGLRSLAGGEIKEFTNMLNDARQRALDRLREHARTLGANAVIGMAFDSSELGQNMSEILAYGTAVIIEAESAESSPVRLV
ncbi:MAG: heavy metal-binding domain-containing protein [Sulfobacillus sp.]|nr:heavy metal-binding domain-containing protein [Sulfobacillus sp.]